MSKIGKLGAGLIAATMVMSFAGCGKDISWSAKIDKNTYTPGTYIYYTANGYHDAVSKLPEGKKEKDLFSTKIENKDASDYIKDYATDKILECYAIEKEFDKQGLKISDFNKKDIKNTTDDAMKKQEDVFKKLGVSRESLEYIVTTNKKYDMLFNKYYDKGGVYEVSDDEINQKVKTDYAQVRIIAKSLKDKDGKDLSDTDKKAIIDDCNSKLEEIKSGKKTFMDVYDANQLEANANYTVSEEDKNNEDREKQVISEDNKAYVGEELVKAALETEIGDIKVVQTDSYVYIIERYDMVANAKTMETYRLPVLHKLKMDEFDGKLKDMTKDVTIKKNDAVYKKYAPKKLTDKLSTKKK